MMKLSCDLLMCTAVARRLHQIHALHPSESSSWLMLFRAARHRICHRRIMHDVADMACDGSPWHAALASAPSARRVCAR